MAVITQTNGVVTSDRAINVSRTALGASDTLTWQLGAKQALYLHNTTGSIVTVNLVGSAPTTLSPPGYGGNISTSAGKDVAVPANGATLVPLDAISPFLTGTGTVTATGGTGVVATLFTLI